MNEVAPGRAFALTFDYRCPFARNMHEHVLAALEAKPGWEVGFWPFSLDQANVAPGGADVWDDDSKAPDLLALQAGIAVRDLWPERFPAFHRELFGARHDHGRDLRERAVVAEVAGSCGVAPDDLLRAVDGGRHLDTLRREHRRALTEYRIFGVPTLVTGAAAVFVRIMDRPADPAGALRTVERLLDTIAGWPELNELKHTSIPR